MTLYPTCEANSTSVAVDDTLCYTGHLLSILYTKKGGVSNEGFVSAVAFTIFIIWNTPSRGPLTSTLSCQWPQVCSTLAAFLMAALRKGIPMTIPAQSPADPISARQVQANFVTYFRLFADLPGIQFTEAKDITWIASRGLPGTLVLSTRFAEADPIARIEETLRQIGQHGREVDWFVFPDCQPHDLGKSLAAVDDKAHPDDGWTLYGNIGAQPGTWMVIDLADLPDTTQTPDGFHIRQVTNQRLFDEWTQINARGFGGSDYSSFIAAYSRHGFGDDAQAVHFIGYLNGEAVTSSTLLTDGGSASVYNVSTPQALRRQGLATAITHVALKHAADFGYCRSWIWSSDLGKSVYAKLGFVVTDFGIREYQWKKASQALSAEPSASAA